MANQGGWKGEKQERAKEEVRFSRLELFRRRAGPLPEEDPWTRFDDEWERYPRSEMQKAETGNPPHERRAGRRESSITFKYTFL